MALGASGGSVAVAVAGSALVAAEISGIWAGEPVATGELSGAATGASGPAAAEASAVTGPTTAAAGFGAVTGPASFGAAADVAGATADVAGATADVTGATADVIGASPDVTGATADVTGATADVTGEATDPVPETGLAVFGPVPVVPWTVDVTDGTDRSRFRSRPETTVAAGTGLAGLGVTAEVTAVAAAVTGAASEPVPEPDTGAAGLGVTVGVTGAAAGVTGAAAGLVTGAGLDVAAGMMGADAELLDGATGAEGGSAGFGVVAEVTVVTAEVTEWTTESVPELVTRVAELRRGDRRQRRLSGGWWRGRCCMCLPGEHQHDGQHPGRHDGKLHRSPSDAQQRCLGHGQLPFRRERQF